MTHVQIVLDESSSMGSTLEETISGFNEYLDTLKKDEHADDLRFSLTKFNSTSWVVYTDRKLADVPRLDKDNFTPSGMTALLDAVGQSITVLARTGNPDDRYLVIILTDGGENSSREFKTAAVETLISARREKNWTFVFLGADERAWGVSQSLSIPIGNTGTFGRTGHGHTHAFRNLAGASTNYVASSSATTSTIFQDANIDNTVNVDDEDTTTN